MTSQRIGKKPGFISLIKGIESGILGATLLCVGGGTKSNDSKKQDKKSHQQFFGKVSEEMPVETD